MEEFDGQEEFEEWIYPGIHLDSAREGWLVSREFYKPYNEVRLERSRQDKKWGEQNHEPFAWLAILMEEVGEASTAALKAKFENYEWRLYREELVQIAAVAVAMIESYDRGKWTKYIDPPEQDKQN